VRRSLIGRAPTSRRWGAAGGCRGGQHHEKRNCWPKVRGVAVNPVATNPGFSTYSRPLVPCAVYLRLGVGILFPRASGFCRFCLALRGLSSHAWSF